MSNTLDGKCYVQSPTLCESDQVGICTRIWTFAHLMEGQQ